MPSQRCICRLRPRVLGCWDSDDDLEDSDLPCEPAGEGAIAIGKHRAELQGVLADFRSQLRRNGLDRERVPIVMDGGTPCGKGAAKRSLRSRAP